MHGLVAVSLFVAAGGFFFVGLGVLLWGVGKLKHGEAAGKELELKERHGYYGRHESKEA